MCGGTYTFLQGGAQATNHAEREAELDTRADGLRCLARSGGDRHYADGLGCLLRGAVVDVMLMAWAAFLEVAVLDTMLMAWAALLEVAVLDTRCQWPGLPDMSKLRTNDCFLYEAC